VLTLFGVGRFVIAPFLDGTRISLAMYKLKNRAVYAQVFNVLPARLNFFAQPAAHKGQRMLCSVGLVTGYQRSLING
jgi:hypothetical protein